MKWEGTAVFGEKLVFWLGTGDVFNLSLLKAQHDPKILSGGKQGLLASLSESYSHTMFSKDVTSSRVAAPSHHPNEGEICTFGLELS